ncbi:hypothetical protein HYH03_010687 [Edaphochlamys debaryana]|uniref:RING-type domain-containing protein n=1 Tax=Edaphochlamys debaryana TaxID=47281 RepID=A0A835Y1V2_9CHLO|nr:hypothetical protein HYH03_010687 [Edaphochlamys debaryana]|eukprot:KAG2491015.1 hypothetical protein HYH03_010687 [Edaphochlamys debaryana]
MSVSGDASAYAEAFAKALHDRWGVGDPACNNGVLMLLSLEDRQLYISTGAGSVSRLSYGVLGNIIEDVKPVLRAGRYDEAVERAVVDIGLALAGRPVEPPQGHVVRSGILSGGYVPNWPIWRYRDCRSKLEKLKRDQAALHANSYNPTSCPVCLEDFSPDPDASSTATTNSDRGACGSGTGSAAAGGQAGPFRARAGPGRSHGQPHRADVEGGAEPEAPVPYTRLDANSGCVGDVTASVGAIVPGRPLVLPCGHSFCEPCIAAWLKKNSTCPICRRPMYEGDVLGPSPDPNTSTSPADPSGTRAPGYDRYGPDILPVMGAGPHESRPLDEYDIESDGAFTTTVEAVLEHGSRTHVGGGTGMGPGLDGFGSINGARLRLRLGHGRRNVGRPRMDEDMLVMEMRYRVRQLQRQHPEYVTPRMASTWEQDLQCGRELCPQQIQQLQLRDPAVREALWQSGSGGSGGSDGSSSSFGGGSCSGGGGCGGSW